MFGKRLKGTIVEVTEAEATLFWMVKIIVFTLIKESEGKVFRWRPNFVKLEYQNN